MRRPSLWPVIIVRARTSSAVQPTPFEHLQLICYYREFTSEHAMLLLQGTVYM